MSTTPATWDQFATDAPELADTAWARLAATKHHILATLRKDGSPRVSGTEVQLYGPDLTVGSMPAAVKAKDLQRDGRFALHANPGDGSMEGGDAKVSGLAVEVTSEPELTRFQNTVEAPPGPFHLFRLLLSEVVVTSLHPDGDRLVIETWRPGEGVRRVERA
jgi:hypothetical protein